MRNSWFLEKPRQIPTRQPRKRNVAAVASSRCRIYHFLHADLAMMSHAWYQSGPTAVCRENRLLLMEPNHDVTYCCQILALMSPE